MSCEHFINSNEVWNCGYNRTMGINVFLTRCGVDKCPSTTNFNKNF